MDITATFLGLCKAKRALDVSVAKALQKNRETTTTSVDKPPQTEFQKRALEVLALISQAKDQILQHRKDYLDPHSRLSDSQRTELETEVLSRLQTCNDTIKKLKPDARHNRTLIQTHRMTVLTILEAYLTAVSRLLAEQQSIRVKRALDHAKLSKLETGTKTKKPSAPLESSLPSTPKKKHNSDLQNGVPLDEPSQRTRTESVAEKFSTEELTMFANENTNLYEELSGMEDEVRVIENQMTEITRLQQVFTENVLIQEHQIENVAAQAVGATENIKSGNIDIREAIQKTASFRAWILFVVLVLSFTLLFLDWYND